MTRARWCRSSLLAAVLAGCASPPAPDEASAAEVILKEAKAGPPARATLDTEAATPAPAPTAAPPERAADRELPWQDLPAGVVPAAMIGDVMLSSPSRPILARARACDRPKLGADCNYGGPEILGFDATGVALVYPPESGHPEVWPLVGEIAELDGTSRERETITRTGALADREYVAARLKGWKWFARVERAGFSPAAPLVWALSAVPHGDTGHSPVAFLRAPLQGWMLYVAAEGDELVARLVAPDNQRAYRLGALPIEARWTGLDESGSAIRCAEPRRYALASVRAAALDPARRRLVVLLSLSYGTSDEVDRTLWRIWPLPPDAVPADAP